MECCTPLASKDTACKYSQSILLAFLTATGCDNLYLWIRDLKVAEKRRGRLKNCPVLMPSIHAVSGATVISPAKAPRTPKTPRTRRRALQPPQGNSAPLRAPIRQRLSAWEIEVSPQRPETHTASPKRRTRRKAQTPASPKSKTTVSRKRASPWGSQLPRSGK